MWATFIVCIEYKWKLNIRRSSNSKSDSSMTTILNYLKIYLKISYHLPWFIYCKALVVRNFTILADTKSFDRTSNLTEWNTSSPTPLKLDETSRSKQRIRMTTSIIEFPVAGSNVPSSFRFDRSKTPGD